MKWISVKDRLPECTNGYGFVRGVFVMNIDYNHDIHKGTYHENYNQGFMLDSRCGGRCDRIPIVVTHWCEIEYPEKVDPK